MAKVTESQQVNNLKESRCSYLIVCAVFEGEVAWDGGHGFGEAEAGVRHLVWHNVGAVEGKVHLPPPAHVSLCAIQLHLDNIEYTGGDGFRSQDL